MNKLYKTFRWLGVISGAIGLISLIPCPEVIFALLLPFPSAVNKMTILPLVFLFALTPIFIIITNILSFRDKKLFSKVLSAVLIIVLVLPIVTIGNMFLRRYQPQTLIIKSPVINKKNLPVYKECIRYAKERNDDKNLTFHNGYRVIIEGQFYMLAGNQVEIERVNNAFSAQEISEMKAICSKLYEIGCVRFQRYEDFFIFYKTAYSSKGSGPGVLYSLSGVNPNNIDHEILNECKPFVNIAGKWYTSRHLLLKGPRSSIKSSIRESVFEDSLKINEDIRYILENDEF